MGRKYLFSAVATASIITSAPVWAQDATEAGTVETAVKAPDTTIDAAKSAIDAAEAAVESASAEASSRPEPVYKTAADGSACELHVWPTENYIGINTGLLSGFGIVGALADQASHKNRVATVKDLMEDYLGPRVQLEELEKLSFTEKLKLGGYKVIIEEPSPSHEDAKADPEVKAKAKAMNKTIKAKKRLTDSTAPCYAELFTTHIFYHKAMMYGSNLFTGWIYRDFDGDTQTKVGKGQVKNPLEYFPPKTEDMIEEAKIEMRDAYSKNSHEDVEKKGFKVKRQRR